jgi:glycosyltransferase involved in cell wall biosynthesis
MATKITIFIPCSGLGRIRRGYESFTQECFDALRGSPGLDLRLFKGGGVAGDNQTVLWNLPRDTLLACCLGKLMRRTPYFIEQFTFFLSLRRSLAAARPDVVYFSDGNLGNLLWRWRRLHGHRYRLLFSNGGPLSPPFPRWDFVQQVSTVYYDDAKKAGQPDARQVLLPYGFAIPAQLPARDPAAVVALRARLGLPAARAIVLSVGAVNGSHKRMDYLIRELAMLPAPRPFLLMLGQRDSETAGVAALSDELLGAANHQIRSVRHEEMGDYYQASDVFALASLHEGFGRVLVEAMAQGLPCLTHDYAVAREVLGKFGHFADFTQPGRLASLLQARLNSGSSDDGREARHRHAYDNYSWETLQPQYVDMLRQCASLAPLSAFPR